MVRIPDPDQVLGDELDELAAPRDLGRAQTYTGNGQQMKKCASRVIFMWGVRSAPDPARMNEMRMTE